MRSFDEVCALAENIEKNLAELKYIELHENIDVLNTSRFSAAEYFASIGKTVVAQHLIDLGANKNWAVRGAAYGGDRDFTEALIDQGADKNLAVAGAAKAGHKAFTQKLIEQGANKDLAVAGAAKGGHEAFTQELIEQGASIVEQGASIVEQGASKNSAVLGAAQGGHIAFAEALIKQGASKDWAVHGAAGADNRDFAEALIKQGASKDFAVHGAAEAGHRDFAEALIQQDASKDWAVLGAAEGGHRDFTEALINDYADAVRIAVKGAIIGGHHRLADQLLASKCETLRTSLFNHGDNKYLKDFEQHPIRTLSYYSPSNIKKLTTNETLGLNIGPIKTNRATQISTGMLKHNITYKQAYTCTGLPAQIIVMAGILSSLKLGSNSLNTSGLQNVPISQICQIFNYLAPEQLKGQEWKMLADIFRTKPKETSSASAQPNFSGSVAKIS